MGPQSDELIRTYFEKIMCQALADLHIPYRIFALYCFRCKSWFEWSKYSIPRCHIGGHDLVARDFARPDILITGGPDNKTLGVIRIDGAIHQKKRIKNKDYFQTRNFLDQGVKVFIVENSDINPKRPDYAPNFAPHYFALLFKRLLDEPELYDRLYLSSRYFNEHVGKI